MASIFELWFGQSTEERLLREILIGQRKIMSALNIVTSMEIKQMADFKKLEDEVAATRGAVESTKVFVKGLEDKIAELAEGMNDADDQAKVEAFATELATIRSTLPQAIVENPGGSTGGIKE